MTIDTMKIGHQAGKSLGEATSRSPLLGTCLVKRGDHQSQQSDLEPKAHSISLVFNALRRKIGIRIQKHEFYAKKRLFLFWRNLTFVCRP